MKKKSTTEVLISIRVPGKLDVELTREEASQLLKTLENALGSIRMEELESTLRKVLEERILKNMTPFAVMPPVIVRKPNTPFTIPPYIPFWCTDKDCEVHGGPGSL